MELFKDKTVLVTGCNRGIGKTLLQRYAAEGADVIACVRNKSSEFSDFVQSLCSQYNVSINVLYADFSNEDSVKCLIRYIYSMKRKVDILVNNAGVVTMKILPMTTMEELKNVFQVNFFSQVLLTQGVSKLMMKQKEGIIINMSSVGGLDSFPAYTAYGCSKAAMSYFTKTLSQELSPYNIRVNAVAPGLVETGMKSHLSTDATDEVIRRSAMHRAATTDEVCDLIIFLSSDKSSYINGQIIRVDGGM